MAYGIEELERGLQILPLQQLLLLLCDHQKLGEVYLARVVGVYVVENGLYVPLVHLFVSLLVGFDQLCFLYGSTVVAVYMHKYLC